MDILIQNASPHVKPGLACGMIDASATGLAMDPVRSAWLLPPGIEKTPRA